MHPQLDSITSADGTQIAVERGGDGPPLVLVHGTAADHRVWEPVVDDLREHFTVVAMDRRGRGASGDAEAYAIEREFEDVATVVESIDRPVALLGHSFGAVSALGASRMVENLRGLLLYEPPLWRPGRPDPPADLVERLRDHAQTGEHEAILEVFFRDLTDSEERLKRYRSSPTWPMRVAAAPTVPREVAHLGDFRPEPGDFADVTVPTLVSYGSETRAGLSRSTERAHELLPESELRVIEGVGHDVMATAPERFVEMVVEFVLGRGAE
ncbi:MAG: alpha/beta fold hydrolase [Halodesulfurarchaeum sp.]